MKHLTAYEMDYPNADKAKAPAMIEALEAVMGSYIFCTGSHQETEEMKRARTLVGLILDIERGNI